MGALSKLDEFLLNPQFRTCSVAVPGTSRNSNSENWEPTGDCSLDDLCLEVRFFSHHSGNLNSSEVEEFSHSLVDAVTPRNSNWCTYIIPACFFPESSMNFDSTCERSLIDKTHQFCNCMGWSKSDKKAYLFDISPRHSNRNVHNFSFNSVVFCSYLKKRVSVGFLYQNARNRKTQKMQIVKIFCNIWTPVYSKLSEKPVAFLPWKIRSLVVVEKSQRKASPFFLDFKYWYPRKVWKFNSYWLISIYRSLSRPRYIFWNITHNQLLCFVCCIFLYEAQFW